MSPTEHQNFTRYAPFAVMGVLALLGGTFFTILNVQQNQDSRSRASVTTSGNLVINPGFESQMSNWYNWSNTSTVTGNAHSGSYSIRVGTSNGSAGQAKIPSAAGTQYTVSAWGKVSKSDEVGDFGLNYYNSSGSKIGYNRINFTSTSYTFKEQTFTAPSGTAKVEIYVHKDTNSGGYFYADDLSITSTTSSTQPSTDGSSFTFGLTTVGSHYDSGNNNSIHCNQYTSPNAGSVAAMSVYISNVDSYEKTYAMALYNDTGSNHPGALQSKTINGQLVDGWNTLPITGQVSASGKYWLCFNSKTTNNSKNQMRYADGSNPIVWKDVAFGTWPSPFGSKDGGWGDNMSIYATVSNGGSPTSTPMPTPTTSVPTPTSVQPTPTKTPTPTPTTAGPTPTRTPTPTAVPTDVPQPTNTPMPTPTLVPGSTNIKLSLGLHGLGKGGDSANPNGTGNMTPLRSQRTVSVEVYNDANVLVKNITGTVAFDASSGYFEGVISLGTDVATGAHQIRVKTDQFLRTLVPGIQNLTAGETKELPRTALVNGDINSDNSLNILDYNILMGCYSDLSPATNCPAGDELRADITDDGDVNQFDYNLFLRELINRGGQ